MRGHAIMRWPMREALEAFRMHLVREAWEAYRNALLVWAPLAPWSKKAPPPKLPPILRNITRGS